VHLKHNRLFQDAK